jgi:hypothetical protein
MAYPTFEAFQETKKILDQQEDIIDFFEKVAGLDYNTDYPVYKLYVYADQYYLEELPSGQFTTLIGNREPTGDLITVEKELWDWAEAELKNK